MSAGRSARRLPMAIGALIGAVAIGFLVRALITEWEKVREALAGADVGLLVLAVALAGLSMAHLGWLWADAIWVFDTRPRPRRSQVVVWWFVGELGKYVPGGVLSVVGRAEVARRAGVPRSAAYGSVPFSLVLRYIGGMAAFAVLVPFDLANQQSLATLVAVTALPLSLAVLHPVVLSRLKALAERLARRSLTFPIPSWGRTVRLVADYLPNWALVVASTWCVARAISPDAPILRITLATLLSWTLGFLAFPIPAGAGVREAVFVASSGLPTGLGVTVAIASRLAFILVDALGAGLATPRLRRSRLVPGLDEPDLPEPVVGAEQGGDA